ncbi:MAG TPA: hypothetical protein VMH02_05415 [Verrucomicrobiae bacterium]|nr:hypothetical protein [Verrucomicrobiae bacterium]
MKERDRDDIIRALDLAAVREWNDAKTLLRPLDDPIAVRLSDLLEAVEREQSQMRRSAEKARHELGNALSIARANLEAIADGLLEATPDRIEGILASLASSGRLLDELRGR